MIIKMIKRLQKIVYTTIVKMRVERYVHPLHVNAFSWVSSKTILGKNINFNGIKIQGCGDVVIGDNFHSGKECMIITQNHNYEGEMIPYDNTYICKKTIIGDNVWFGHRVIVLPGISIGEGAVIQAGAVVSSDIPECAIAGGNPAKVFSYRDKEHYDRLKKEGKFN